jgi:uncharacterized Fe-S cluster protein YjdI
MEQQRQITKRYKNDEITIVWQPQKCIHSGICFRGLPTVFDPRKRPWITIEGADSEVIMKQIEHCPSGALSFMKNQENTTTHEIVEEETIVEVTKNGPLLVFGNISIKNANGDVTQKNNVTALCRCGASENKPFCDGSHAKIDFVG